MDRRFQLKRAPRSSPSALALAAAILFLSLLLAAEQVDYRRDVQPILEKNCYACHGEKIQMQGLRLDTVAGILKGGDRGPVVVPGKSVESRLIQAVTGAEGLVRMPFQGSPLAKEQIALLKAWIDQGAKPSAGEQSGAAEKSRVAGSTTHWAYVPPKRPEEPRVRNQAWIRNPIDSFVLARLERERLKSSPEADKATSLRRVSLDLTGLPPTLAEVEAFLADRSPDAYEKQVDRLLHSPRYGERMAMQWLDLARYADTHGYHIDSHRDMWRWRDWVIDAFNRNVSFDRFTLEQLAGDLLPNPTVQQKMATGFNRNHMINFEGGAIPDEYLTEYVVDRVETTATVWMGLTMGCARCHDHKYEPINQKEFYRFFAFFHNVAEKGLDGRTGNADPVVKLPSPEQRRELEELTCEIEEKERAVVEKTVAGLQAEWEKTRLETLPEPPRNGLLAHYELDSSLADTSGNYRHARTLRGEVTYSSGQVFRAADFSGETHVELGQVAAFERTDPFTLALWVRTGAPREMAVLQKLASADGRRGLELAFDHSIHVGDLKRGAYLYFRLIQRWPEQAIAIRTKDRLFQSNWYHIAIAYDGSGKASGLTLFLNGKREPFEVLLDNLAGSIQNLSPLELGNKNIGLPYKGQMDDFRVYNRPLAPAEVETLAIHLPIRAILSEAAGKRSKDQREKLREYFLAYDAPHSYRTLHAELKSLKARKERLEKIIPTSMVMDELKKPRETFLLVRGDYRQKGEKVEPGFPAVLPALPKDAPRNRLGLARWLVDPAHPLTARVAVNRFWQMYFGVGLVKTSEDLGSQGEPPSHPELLDWLATEFIRTGWDVKAVQRLIVTSATYRQSSRMTPELRAKDPENRLLARGPRFRLPAEMVRDNALSASGLLNEQMGGPGVFPYQPKGLWEEIAYGDVYSAQSYAAGSGKDLYRRSMYTFWKRTSPPPSLAIFDAPDREKCTARRPVTNTPLQALALMNDPTYVESARALAQRMMTEAGKDPARRIAFAFRLATARAPSPRELQILRETAGKQLAHYRRNKDAAGKLLRVGESRFDPKLDVSELAAWTTVASTILNLDETITKE